MAFDLGGRVAGSSTSVADQSSAVSFLPSVTGGDSSGPLVSTYPTGQGLASINSAYPASAAYQSSTYAPAAAAPASTTTGLLLLAAAAAAFLLLRKRR